MKLVYEKPQIEIKVMDSENILTASAVQSTYDALTSGGLSINGDTVDSSDIIFSVRF